MKTAITMPNMDVIEIIAGNSVKMLELAIPFARKFPMSDVNVENGRLVMNFLADKYMITMRVDYLFGKYWVWCESSGKLLNVDNVDIGYDDIEKTMDRVCVLFAKIPAWCIENPEAQLPYVDEKFTHQLVKKYMSGEHIVMSQCTNNNQLFMLALMYEAVKKMS